MDCYTMHTPVGWIRLEADDSAILRLILNADRPCGANVPPSPLLSEAANQILEYFQGTRTEFSLPLRPEGTEFQKTVWACLQNIPYGTTYSYRDLAAAAGTENGCRAVGNANSRNPIPILIPCHRVIRSDGSLGGYSGGTGIKESLLMLESLILARQEAAIRRKKHSRRHREAETVRTRSGGAQ